MNRAKSSLYRIFGTIRLKSLFGTYKNGRILTAIEVQQPHQLGVRLPVGPQQNHAERRVNAQRRKDFGGFVAGLQYGGAQFLCELQHIFGQLIGNGGVKPRVGGQPVRLLLAHDRRYGGQRQQRKQSEFR